MTTAYLNRIATAVPEHDVHDVLCRLRREDACRPAATHGIPPHGEPRCDRASLFISRSAKAPAAFSSHDAQRVLRLGDFPNTTQRMELFEQSAPVLMRKAVDRLALSEEERAGITHVLVTCCTGLYAPGLDFEIVEHLGLSPVWSAPWLASWDATPRSMR